MVTEIHDTLYSAIKDHEGHFEKAVLDGMEKGLTELGGGIYKLDWACIAASAKNSAAKAA
jgi:hypothetical protein